jgi:hypothetical protein
MAASGGLLLSASSLLLRPAWKAATTVGALCELLSLPAAAAAPVSDIASLYADVTAAAAGWASQVVDGCAQEEVARTLADLGALSAALLCPGIRMRFGASLALLTLPDIDSDSSAASTAAPPCDGISMVDARVATQFLSCVAAKALRQLQQDGDASFDNDINFGSKHWPYPEPFPAQPLLHNALSRDFLQAIVAFLRTASAAKDTEEVVKKADDYSALVNALSTKLLAL